MRQHTHDGRFEAELLYQVQVLLDTGQADKALEALRSTGQRSKALLNAYGVCLMRTGQVDKANAVFRNLVIPGQGFCLDPEAPTIFKTNYAVALLLGKHVDGCIGVLNQIEDQAHPAVVKIRSAIEEWKRTLGRLRRFFIPILGLPDTTVPMGFPPGDLWIKELDGPTRRAA